MDNLKENYNAIDEWYKKQNKHKIDTLMKERIYYDDKNPSPQAKFTNTIEWYEEIKLLSEELKSYIFGDKILTLKEIADAQLSVLPSAEETEKRISIYYKAAKEVDDEDYDDDGDERPGCAYDSCGHSSTFGDSDLIAFWENFDEDRLRSVAGGATMDEYEVDVNGGRSYYMSKNIYCMIFNYLYYTLKMTPQEFDKNICNSGDDTEEISFYYSGRYYAKNGLIVYLPTDEELNDMYNKINKKNIDFDEQNFNGMLRNIIDEFSNKPGYAERVEALKRMKS